MEKSLIIKKAKVKKMHKKILASHFGIPKDIDIYEPRNFDFRKRFIFGQRIVINDNGDVFGRRRGIYDADIFNNFEKGISGLQIFPVDRIIKDKKNYSSFSTRELLDVMACQQPIDLALAIVIFPEHNWKLVNLKNYKKMLEEI